jgi:hypothetical protein
MMDVVGKDKLARAPVCLVTWLANGAAGLDTESGDATTITNFMD